MKFPLGKVRCALVFLFVILAAYLLVAQRVRDEQKASPGMKLAPTGDGQAVEVPD